jgi:hypothetical protein
MSTRQLDDIYDKVAAQIRAQYSLRVHLVEHRRRDGNHGRPAGGPL